MALSPDEKFIYVNPDTGAGQFRLSKYYPVRYLRGLECATAGAAKLYFRGPLDTNSTQVTISITSGFIKQFLTEFVNEINFGESSVIVLSDRNIAVDATTGGTDFQHVNAFSAAITTSDSLTAGFEDVQITEDLDIGGDTKMSGSLTLDSVALSTVQTSAESFADNDTSVMTSAAIDDRINTAVATTVGSAVDLTSEVSGTLPVGNGGTGLTTVAANTILTGNGTSALTSESNLTFSANRMIIGADDEITPQLRFRNDENTVTLGVADATDNLISGSVDGDFVINCSGDHNVLISQNNTIALTIDTDGDVVIANGITLGGHSVNDIDVAGEFVDSDEHLMTSAAINDRIAAAGGGVSVSDSTANTDFPVVFHDESNNLHDDTAAFEYNPSTGNLTVSKINGNTPVIGGKIAVASEAQAPIGMHIARRTITTAEANAMNSTPIEVVPAQGANTIIVPVNCLSRVDRAANQTNSACDMNAHYADKEPGTYLTASLLHWRRFMYGETTDHSEMRTPVSSTSGVTLTESVNKGIELSFDSAATTNCFTSIDIFMTYYIIDIS
tara:strand:+ start:1856 stop:3529 length:1674 start_codon:yes stop_codon:yes gene_type:complete